MTGEAIISLAANLAPALLDAGVRIMAAAGASEEEAKAALAAELRKAADDGDAAVKTVEDAISDARKDLAGFVSEGG